MNFLRSSIVHQALYSLKACADKCYEGEHDIGQFYRVVLGQIAQDVWFKVDGYVVNHVGNITEEEIGQHVERKPHHAFPSPVLIDLGQKRYCPRKEISPSNNIGQNNEESRVGHNDERRQNEQSQSCFGGMRHVRCANVTYVKWYQPITAFGWFISYLFRFVNLLCVYTANICLKNIQFFKCHGILHCCANIYLFIYSLIHSFTM